MQVYIDKVRDTIQQLCDTLVGTGRWSGGDLRFGLHTFRDHSPQGDEGRDIVDIYPFDSDVGAVKENLANIRAEGGGDGPEAQCDAFASVPGAAWDDDATRIAILITDSPPHGLGEDADTFPQGCPRRMLHIFTIFIMITKKWIENDPVRLVGQMARLGIILVRPASRYIHFWCLCPLQHVLACEPTLSMDYSVSLGDIVPDAVNESRS